MYVRNCGNYANAKANNNLVVVNGTEFYFSYETLIAIRRGCNQAIRKNDWGPTTGKHLNAIDPDHSIRLDADAFQIKVAEITALNN